MESNIKFDRKTVLELYNRPTKTRVTDDLENKIVSITLGWKRNDEKDFITPGVVDLGLTDSPAGKVNKNSLDLEIIGLNLLGELQQEFQQDLTEEMLNQGISNEDKFKSFQEIYEQSKEYDLA